MPDWSVCADGSESFNRPEIEEFYEFLANVYPGDVVFFRVLTFTASGYGPWNEYVGRTFRYTDFSCYHDIEIKEYLGVAHKNHILKNLHSKISYNACI